MIKRIFLRFFAPFFLLIFVSSCSLYDITEKRIREYFSSVGLTSALFKTKDTTLHYWIGGKGKPIVILHGFGTDSRFQWVSQVGELAKKYSVIMPDLVYFDKSSSSSGDFSVDFQAKTILELLNSLNAEEFFLMGASYGGLVGITLTDMAPEKVKSLILCDSPVKFYTNKHNEKALEKFSVSSIEELLVPSTPEGLPRLLSLAYRNPPIFPTIYLRDTFDKMFTIQTEEKRNLLRYLKDYEDEFLKKEYEVKCKTLLVWGEYDLLIPPEIGKKLKSYLKNDTRLEVFKNTAHMPNMEKPALFNKLILEFLGQEQISQN